ncbi:hypothetical protein [Kutzneria sp. NPDC052558]|uniref:hypothetical protein n=1 Tax=Kutzneria sp. NPDC052558 TaxID=3364121 RepID=UPI0037CCBDF2
MSFEMGIDTSKVESSFEPRLLEPWEDLDDLALPLCELLDEAGVRFFVGGFGDRRWPVDVRYDLATIIPQLPAVIDSLQSRLEAELDFYEQGIQRTVMIDYSGDRVVLKCSSFGKWKPLWLTEECVVEDFRGMLSRFVNRLSFAVSVAVPSLSSVDPLERWSSWGN